MKRLGDVPLDHLVPSGKRKEPEVVIDDDVCPICKGAGYLQADVPFGHPFFARAIPCECLMREQEERAFADLQRLSQLDPFRDKTFENFDPKVPGVDAAYRAAKTFARDPSGWLILCGGVGTGKTHLAAAIANWAVNNHIRVLFAVVPDLLDHLRSTFAPSSTVQYDELFESVRATPLLILDDLGTENCTPWAGEKLYQIFNYRYNERLPTVVTTNRDLGRIDDRIRSRLRDDSLCEIVVIKGEDYRPRKKGERKYAKVSKPQYRR